MQYSPPISVSSDTEDTYNVRIYHDTKYDIENIYNSIEYGYLDKATIPKSVHAWLWSEDFTLTVYNIWDYGFNVFILGPKEIEGHHELTATEAIDFIKDFLNT
jgi:hypothetical protein